MDARLTHNPGRSTMLAIMRPVCKPQAENVEISNAPDGFIPAREFCDFLHS